MAARVAPKMASLMGSASAKVARPMVRSNLGAQRTFTAMSKTSKTAFQAVKRQQTSQILSKTQFAARRPYSSEMANALVQASQNLGMGGAAAIGLAGAGVGIGLVFAALLQAVCP
ncbi:hypothetical protein EYC84_007989 [Monilinia fructicola]|uniref:ATP synthase subunit 9, mitochondrial n=1 Tax=Monilinia fructicola TaxID=38448 RepID=A0A5M9JGR3_MONFR|nr:hypothetical protein EYC84_007989 [Monilinia fructicola]